MTGTGGFHGIYPMLYAFFGADGELDREAMRRQTEAAIRAGAHGIAVGGLCTEANKLSTAERRRLIEWVAEDVAGRVPLSVTITENSIPGQREVARLSADVGAAWIALQPPPAGGAEAELIRFYGAVAEGSALPVGIQNAPDYIGIGLSNAGFATLNRNHPNVSILKAEGPATYIAQLIADTQGVFTVFNGRNGIELVDSLRAGCQGAIPAVDTVDAQVRIYELMRANDEAAAERAFAELLPLINFPMYSMDYCLAYGKRLAARRFALGEVHDRPPSLMPTGFGLDLVQRWSRGLPPLAGEGS